MALRLIVEVPAAGVFPGLAILLTLRIQEHHLAMGIDAFLLRRCRIQTHERCRLLVHLLNQRINVSIIAAHIRIVFRVGHILKDREVLDGLEKHRNELFL